MGEPEGARRRNVLSGLVMGLGLLLSYGVFAVEGLLFLLPKRLKPHTRKLFAGRIEQYRVGSVQRFYDLQGNEILVKRDATGFQAFSSICPHLGCRVHWEEDKQRFFCPCHRGVFDANGIAIAGPPAAAGQRLFRVPMQVDAAGGVVYIEVKDVKRRSV